MVPPVGVVGSEIRMGFVLRASGERLFYGEAHPGVTRPFGKGMLFERKGDPKA